MKCVWIGIGADIGKDSALYPDLLRMRETLDKKYGNASKAKFHLNVYDLAVPEENIDRITESLFHITAGLGKIAVPITGVTYFPFGAVFIQLGKDPHLLALHESVVEAVCPLRGDCVEPTYTESKRQYSERQKAMLAKYGNPFVLAEFNPHITVGFARDTLKLESAKEELQGFLTQGELQVDNLNIVTEGLSKYHELQRFELH